MTILFVRRTTLSAFALGMLALGGCAGEPGGEPRVMGISYRVAKTAAVIDGLTEPDYPTPDPQYAAVPPCVHPGDEEKMAISDRQMVLSLPVAPRCSRRKEADVAYWTSRPDRYRTACKGLSADYCDEKVGMVPHCHGFGKWRFCHAHPGGGSAHDHMHDREYASNAPAE
jgi:hypothetical protein